MAKVSFNKDLCKGCGLCVTACPKKIVHLSDELNKVLSEHGENPLHTEGYRAGGWVLVDFGCVVVHLFLREMRKTQTCSRGDQVPSKGSLCARGTCGEERIGGGPVLSLFLWLPALAQTTLQMTMPQTY